MEWQAQGLCWLGSWEESVAELPWEGDDWRAEGAAPSGRRLGGKASREVEDTLGSSRAALGFMFNTWEMPFSSLCRDPSMASGISWAGHFRCLKRWLLFSPKIVTVVLQAPSAMDPESFSWGDGSSELSRQFRDKSEKMEAGRGTPGHWCSWGLKKASCITETRGGHRARGDIFFQTHTWVIWWETQLDNRIDNLAWGLFRKLAKAVSA